uniref:Uncharacterized protein n=1 Tax=Thermoplasma acidophilum TaxID=2303 RepID=Q0KKY7_THEAI|nr:hypothetical protein [Thermoplasma acidophilum]
MEDHHGQLHNRDPPIYLFFHQQHNGHFYRHLHRNPTEDRQRTIGHLHLLGIPVISVWDLGPSNGHNRPGPGIRRTVCHIHHIQSRRTHGGIVTWPGH